MQSICEELIVGREETYVLVSEQPLMAAVFEGLEPSGRHTRGRRAKAALQMRG